jgi:hypothetical protein
MKKKNIVLKKDRIDMVRDLAITMYMVLLVLILMLAIYVSVAKEIDSIVK